MNALLAVVLMAVLFMVGIEVPFLQDVPPIVGMVEPESPASAAGLEPGDRLVSIDGRAIGRWQDAETEIVQSPERALWLEVERHGELLGIEIVPARAPKYEFGVIGAYPRLQPRVAQVFAGTPAAAVGLEPGDLLRGLDGRPVASPRDFVEYVEGRPDVPIALEIVRGGNARTVEITPARDGEVGRIGIQLTISQRLALGAAVRASVAYNWDVTKQTFTLLGRLFQGRIAPKTALHGPIEIAALSGAAARRGMADFAHLLALVSISIGILNLLPVPVLDGGQIFILLVESAMRRDLSTRFKELVQLAGLFLIVALMITVLYFDLERNLPALLGGSSQGPPP